MPQVAQPITTSDLRLVDSHGHTRFRLSTEQDIPTFSLLKRDGTPAIDISLDATDHPAIRLLNPDGGSTAALEIDAKGAHIKMDRPGGASSYLFLNDAGGSGLVLLDDKGRRRYQLLLMPGADAAVQQFGQDGNLLPATK